MADPVNNVVDTAVGVYTTVDPLLRRLWIAVLILLLGFLAGKLLGKIVQRVLNELHADKALRSATGWKFSIEKIASGFVTYFTYFVAIIMALDTIGVTSAVLNMVAGIVILVLLISFLLAIKDFVPNAVAGISLRNKPEYKKGRKIKIKNIEGRIEEVGLLETKVLTSKKDIILIPNSLFTKNETTIKN